MGSELPLIKATSAAEIKQILAGEGQEISLEEAERLFGKTSLSPDELETLNGGSYQPNKPCTNSQCRSKSQDGCASTVQDDDDDCWGEDGGCYWASVFYTK